MENVIENIKSILKNKNYKLTSQRLEIINVLLERPDDHLNSEEIYEIIKKTNENIGLATIYRNLKLFCELGVLTELDVGDGSARYDLNFDDDSHQHHHLICKKCGKIIEVRGDYLDELEEMIEKKYNFKITNHKLKFYGVCLDCSGTL